MRQWLAGFFACLFPGFLLRFVLFVLLVVFGRVFYLFLFGACWLCFVCLLFMCWAACLLFFVGCFWPEATSVAKEDL